MKPISVSILIQIGIRLFHIVHDVHGGDKQYVGIKLRGNDCNLPILYSNCKLNQYLNW